MNEKNNIYAFTFEINIQNAKNLKTLFLKILVGSFRIIFIYKQILSYI